MTPESCKLLQNDWSDLIFNLYQCSSLSDLFLFFRNKVLKDQQIDGYLVYFLDKNQELVIEDILLPNELDAMEKVLKKTRLFNNQQSFFTLSLQQKQEIFLTQQNYPQLSGDLKNHFEFWKISEAVIIPFPNLSEEVSIILFCFTQRKILSHPYIDYLKQLFSLILLKIPKEIHYEALFHKKLAIQSAYLKNAKVLEIAENINQLTSFETIYKTIIHEILNLFQFDLGIIFIQQHDTLVLTDGHYREGTHYLSRLEEIKTYYQEIGGYKIIPEEGATPTAFLRKTNFYFQEMSNYIHLPMSPKDKGIVDKFSQARTLLIFPITQNNNAVGIFQFWSLQNTVALTENDLDIIKMLSSFIGKAIYNSKLYSLAETQKKELESKNALVKKELDLARTIQQNIIVKGAGEKTGIKFSAIYQPLEEVGGDFFDLVEFNEPHLTGFFISDVSGHGIPAALITVMAKILLETAGHNKYSPAQLLAYVNEKMLHLVSENYLTAVYAVYDSLTRTLSYAGAAHPFFVLLKSDGLVQTFKSKNTMLGIFKKYAPVEDTIKLAPHDKLIFFTDGLLEVREEKIRKIEKQFLEFLSSYAQLNVQELLERIQLEFLGHNQSSQIIDDICVLGIEIQ